MPRSIFVNLPVAELERSIRFYEALGFARNPQFSDDSGACIVLSDTIFVMILSHDKWQTFTKRPIPDSGRSEVLLALSCDSRDAVNAMTEAAARNGGTADINPSQEHGFMMSRAFADPDGHVWEPFWMDPAAIPAEQSEASATV